MDPKELAKARNSPENQKRLENLKKIADADEARRSEGVKIFDPVALLKRASEIHQVYPSNSWNSQVWRANSK